MLADKIQEQDLNGDGMIDLIEGLAFANAHSGWSKAGELVTTNFSKIFFLHSAAKPLSDRRRTEAHLLNKPKFVPSSRLARDPRVHAQLKNKA